MSVDQVVGRSTRFRGKVAFITGAGRGQRRNHAVRLAREGADVALVDLGSAGRVENPEYPTSTGDDLVETRRRVECEGRRAVACEADVRDMRTGQVHYPVEDSSAIHGW